MSRPDKAVSENFETCKTFADVDILPTLRFEGRRCIVQRSYQKQLYFCVSNGVKAQRVLQEESMFLLGFLIQI